MDQRPRWTREETAIICQAIADDLKNKDILALLTANGCDRDLRAVGAKARALRKQMGAGAARKWNNEETGIFLTGIEFGESTKWIQDALQKAGYMRSIEAIENQNMRMKEYPDIIAFETDYDRIWRKEMEEGSRALAARVNRLLAKMNAREQ